MRVMQEDQFKMLQLVIENQTSRSQANQNHMQNSYMYYPYMYGHMGHYPPQFYSHGPQQYYNQMYYHNPQQQSLDESGTETETDIEQIQEGRQ